MQKMKYIPYWGKIWLELVVRSTRRRSRSRWVRSDRSQFIPVVVISTKREAGSNNLVASTASGSSNIEPIIGYLELVPNVVQFHRNDRRSANGTWSGRIWSFHKRWRTMGCLFRVCHRNPLITIERTLAA